MHNPYFTHDSWQLVFTYFPVIGVTLTVTSTLSFAEPAIVTDDVNCRADLSATFDFDACANCNCFMAGLSLRHSVHFLFLSAILLLFINQF